VDHKGAEDDPPAPSTVGRRRETSVVVLVSIGTLFRWGMCHLASCKLGQPLLISRHQQLVPAQLQQRQYASALSKRTHEDVAF